MFGWWFGISCPNAFSKFSKSQGWFIQKIARTKHVITGQSHQTNKNFVETNIF